MADFGTSGSATTLTNAITASQLKFVVGSGTGFPAVGAAPSSYTVRIDNEYMVAVSQPVSGTITVRSRGDQGTVAKAHDLLAKVLVSANPADFNTIPAGTDNEFPPYRPSQSTLGQDTTFTATDIAALNRDVEFAITKASAAAITLVAPTKAQDGITVTFTSLTDAIHVITATALLANSGSGSPYTTATMANAKAGGGLILKAENGLWNVMSAVNWTLT